MQFIAMNLMLLGILSLINMLFGIYRCIQDERKITKKINEVIKMYKNSEGYADPTAGRAIENIKNEEKEKRDIIKAVSEIIHITGYELVIPINIKKLRN